jgi:hypothetical protein
MRRRDSDWQIWVGVGLLVASLLLYFALYEYAPARVGDILFYSFLDIAFIPISVLIVGLILNGLLTYRERASQAKRLNMLIGAFFSEVGTGLLGLLATFDPELERLRADLIPKSSWDAREFAQARADADACECPLDSHLADLGEVRDYLAPRRSFILGMLQNPNLLEHQEFAETLWAVMHLTDEVTARRDLTALPEPDMAHLSIDLQRAYKTLLEEWLHHMEHLKTDYPYLFALAVRTNPFDPEARVEVAQ